NTNVIKRINTTQSYISRIENGTINPSVSTFYRIINALGMRIDIVKPLCLLFRSTLHRIIFSPAGTSDALCMKMLHCRSGMKILQWEYYNVSIRRSIL
ncbi:MAG: helix-turn-helix transcriptional regulator, partial [Bacteroides sp.]|nr:helix-turn-helix transcriptional regulator [Bacteroides sp.]